MKNKKKLLVTGITLALTGIFAGGSLAAHMMPSPLAAFAETMESTVDSTFGTNHKADDHGAGLYSDGILQLANKKADKKAPVITEKDVTVDQGTKVNVLEGVTAKDEEDGDLTSRIKTEGTVNTAKAGTYTVKLKVSDDSGNTANAEKKVTVKEPEKVNIEAAAVEATEPAPAENSAPAEESTAPAQTAESTQTVQTTQAAAPAVQTAPSYAPNTMYLAGTAVAYQNGGQGSGQSIIDSNPNGVISTWGGSAVQSGSDGMNTHFIGHNPGIFGALFSLGSGSQIVVTDGNGSPTVYTASTFLQVNDSAVGVSDGQNYWDLIIGTGGGERISLQTCINDTTNYVVIAYA